MKLVIRWGVEDGYCGKARPQHLTIETTDYLEDDQPYEDMTQEEKDEFIDERVKEDFFNKISYSVDSVEEA